VSRHLGAFRIMISQSELTVHGQKSHLFLSSKKFRSPQHLHANSRQSSQGGRRSVGSTSTKKKAVER
jgi:hypothetical protein